MNKGIMLLAVWSLIVVAILLLTIFMPTITLMAETSVNASSGNISNFTGAEPAMTFAPWVFYFIPPAIGLWLTVVIVRGKKQ